MYKIEKGIPIAGIPRKEHSKYPFKDMKINDSFFISDKDITRIKLQSAVAYYSLKHLEWKSTVRKVEGGYRVWRIS